MQAKKPMNRVRPEGTATKKTAFFLLAFVFLFCLPLASMAMSRINVIVSIVPQKYLVDKIGGQNVQVTVMIPPGANPHTYEPKPGQMTLLSNAKIYFTIGIEFERAWLRKLVSQNRKLVVFPMDKNVPKLPMLRSFFKTERPRPKKLPKDASALDPHIWLAPPLVKIMAKNVETALAKVDTENKAFYMKNLDKFLSEVKQVDKKIRLLLKGKDQRSFIVFHPAWSYFAKTYNLREVPVELEGKSPSPKGLKNIINFARQRNIKVIFVEPQFSDRIARIIAKALGGKIIYVDPLAYNWSQNLINVAKTLGAYAR